MAKKKPRYRPKLSDLNDIANELAKVYREVRNGEVEAKDAGKICYLLRELFSMRKEIKTVSAIEQLEADIQALKEGQHVGSDAEIEKISARIHGDIEQ